MAYNLMSKSLIPIYPNEIKNNLGDIIKANASIAYDCVLKPSKITNNLEGLEHPKLAKAGENDQWDLYWLDSILVSVGWNKNDDVFDPGETWLARSSPVHKKFNYMHDEKDIIGHMTASSILLPDGKIFDEEEVPDKYDIVVSSVLYKCWSDDELQKRMDDIIDGIPKGEWFVSMECLFKNFDYALISPDGEHKVVARDNNSSFLTKHLRIYGGSGEYNGYRVGRLLRNFTFSGKGLVSNPANPRSIIFADVNPFNKTTNISFSSINKENEQMADNNEVISQLKDELSKSDARFEKLQAKFDEAVQSIQKAEKERFEKEIAGLKVDVEDLDKQVKAQETELKDKAEAFTKLEKELKESKAKVSELEKQLSESQKETVKASRLAALVEVGVEASKAESIVDKWSEVSDEQFEDVVALHKVSTSEKDMKNDKKTDKKKMDDAEADNNDASASSDVDNAQVDDEDEAALAQADVDEDVELQEAAASWFSKVIKSSKKNQE